jgi:hypothetical protein
LGEKEYKQRTEEFIKNEFTQKDYVLIYKKINYNSIPKKIELAFLSKRFDSLEIKVLNEKMKNYQLSNTELIIKQDSIDLKNDILNSLNNYKKTGDDKDIIIRSFQNKIADYQLNNAKTIREAEILFPEINAISIAQYTMTDKAKNNKTIPVILYKSHKELPTASKEKLMIWLEQRLETDSIEIYRKQ